MALDLPLPKIVPDVGPGGQIFDVYDRLRKAAQESKKRELENKYYGQTAEANTLSKLAYANLMGPQFLAKMMGNENLLANIPDDQKRAILQKIQAAGSGQGTGNALLNNFPMQSSNEDQFGGISAPVVNYILDKINRKDKMQEMQNQNALNQLPSKQANYPEFGANNRANEDEIERIANYGNGMQSSPQGAQPTFAENVGKYKGLVEEGKETGKIRAKNIEELSNDIFTGQTNQTTLDEVSNILSNPIFEQIRQTPLAGKYELAYYAKEGTPAQQQLVGQYYALTGRIIQDSAQNFKGAFRKGEQALLEGMKPSPSDTVDTARGKIESLSYMNKLLTERSRLTSQYMRKYHIDKAQAQEIADKQLNGDAIRKQIHNMVNPRPSDADIKHMAQKYKISESEVKKRLKARGIL